MRQFLFGIQSISEAKNIFLHSILFLLNNTSLYTFIYYRAENPIRRVDTTEKVLILHKTVQGKAYLYVLHYYILYVKTVFQCPRDRVSDWEVWNVEKVICAGTSEGIISGAGTCREVK